MSPSATMERRDDVRLGEGEREYGEVEIADSTNKNYPIDSADHVRAAWSEINHADNATTYDTGEVRTIMNRNKRE